MTTDLAMITAALVGLCGSVVAVSFELLPERVDLIGFVLQCAGTGALVATAFAVIRNVKKSERARWIELGNAYVALVVFLALALIQAVS